MFKGTEIIVLFTAAVPTTTGVTCFHVSAEITTGAEQCIVYLRVTRRFAVQYK